MGLNRFLDAIAALEISTSRDESGLQFTFPEVFVVLDREDNMSIFASN
jgi:hypothetical protein